MSAHATRVDKRHEEILGQEPRIPTPERLSVADEVQAATAKLRGNVLRDATPLALDAIPEIMFTMVPYRNIWSRIMDLSIQIQGPDSVLSVRDRKLAILRTGWLCQAPYEFGEHVAQARKAGFTADDIEHITNGSASATWNSHERAILAAAEELHDGAMISDATWSVLADTLNEHQLVELLVLIGQFTATAFFQNALRLRLEPHNEGLAAR